MEGTLIETLKQRADEGRRRSLRALRKEEAAVLALLQKRLAAVNEQAKLDQILRRSLELSRGRDSLSGPKQARR